MNKHENYKEESFKDKTVLEADFTDIKDDHCHCHNTDCDCGDDCNCYSYSKKDKKQVCNCKECSGKGLFGLIALIFGVLYLGRNLNWWSFDIDWAIFWPVVVIFCGFVILIKSIKF